MPHKKKTKTHTALYRDVFFISGILFALWAFLNTYLDIKRYGIEQGFYWWFCNLALMGTAGGLLFKSRGWLTGFLSIACFTQIFWVIDNFYRILTHKNLFGMVEFMYQPGLPLDEFLLSHYHYFTIPVCLYALVRLPRYRSKSLALILIFNPLIFGVSYFLFPKHQNINCIHAPCFPGLEHWAGPFYSFLFWGCVFMAHIAIGIFLETYFYQLNPTPSFKLLTNKLLAGVLILCGITATLDTQYKLSLPAFTCKNAPINQGVETRCRYTLDDTPNVMLFAYEMKNNSPEVQVCQAEMRLPETTAVLNQPIRLQPGETRSLAAPLVYPRTNVEAQLATLCVESSRHPATK